MKPEEFRRVCSRFATGVAVLTVCDAQGSPHGLTVNSFTSVSSMPPLVLVCVDQAGGLLTLFDTEPRFGLSFLAADQEDISTRFAFVPERRFDGVEWSLTEGVPVVSGSLAWMACTVEQRITAGDHRILIGRVAAGEVTGGGAPLLYFASEYRRLLPT